MNYNEYQAAAKTTAIYPESAKLTYPLLGLSGEFGEICEKVKKHIRDGRELDKDDLTKELGDVLWYLSAVSSDFDIKLNDVFDYVVNEYESAYSVIRYDVVTSLLLLSNAIGKLSEEFVCDDELTMQVSIDNANDEEFAKYQEGLRIELLANILFYLIQLITAFELSIDNIADTNLAKLLSRKERNVLHGSGDNR
jgi:NTP pyrophosphatase (non-canonical NTP hydrolase)